MSDKITLSVIKADVGGFVGHTTVHPEIMGAAKEQLASAVGRGLLVDFHVTHCGDDLELIMTHRKGVENAEVHQLAWNTFVAGTRIAKTLKLYGAGQDLLSDTFSGTVKGMGPGVAEMEFTERPSEPVIVFMADKTSPGAWNYPLIIRCSRCMRTRSIRRVSSSIRRCTVASSSTCSTSTSTGESNCHALRRCTTC